MYTPLIQRKGRTVSTQGGDQDANIEDIAKGISYVETRHNPNAYAIKGKPRPSDGKRAYGKYQVFETNIPSWTKEILGQEMTPDQFLASPEAQEKVARTKFAETFKKYGNANDVASVWFTGRPVAEANNAADYTGTDNSTYQELFQKGMGKGTSMATAGRAGYVPLALRSG